MSKRKRSSGGPVSLCKRLHPGVLHGTKRPGVFMEADSSKRMREYVQQGTKRRCEFDDEVEHLHKRMRATTPTAEEAMGFLLPHLLKFRRMYQEAVQKSECLESKVKQLKAHNCILTKAYNKTIDEKNQLARHLEMSRYQLALAKPNIF